MIVFVTLALFASFAALLIGLIRPRWMTFWRGRQSRGRVAAVYGAFCLLFFVLGIATVPPVEQDAVEAVAPEPVEDVSASQEQDELALMRAQGERVMSIERAIDSGIFVKVESPTPWPRAYVGTDFYNLTDDAKRDVLKTVWMYYINENPEADMVIIRDGQTYEDIGRYYKHGLALD